MAETEKMTRSEAFAAVTKAGERYELQQVEDALLMHRDAREAAIYAVPDERLGEEVGATVYASASAEVEALREFLNEHLARFEVPRYIRTSAVPLPRTALGKILRRQVRDEAFAAMATRAGAGHSSA